MKEKIKISLEQYLNGKDILIEIRKPKKLLKKAKLIKDDFLNYNFTIVSKPDLEVNYRHVGKLNIDEKYQEYISKFVDAILSNFKEKDLTIFYNNINSLKVESYEKSNVENKKDSSKVSASYAIGINKCYIYSSDFKFSLPHELFHMASSLFDAKKMIVYSGFFQYNGVMIGDGLNEGYTELLAQRYITKEDENLSYSYFYLTLFASHLEKIVGKEKMESLYLNADLRGLVEELKQYTNEDNIFKFIACLDYFYRYSEDLRKSKKDKAKILYCLKFIYKFLLACGIQKSVKESLENEIDPNMLNQKINEFIPSFEEVYLYKEQYLVSNTFEDDAIVNKILSKYGIRSEFCQTEEKRI